MATVRAGQRRLIGGTLVVAMVAAATIVGLGSSARADSNTTTFTTVGSSTFVVPAGVISVTVVAQGGAGRDGEGSGNAGAGGSGALVTATLQVTPGQTLSVYVGAIGTLSGGAGGGADGGNGDLSSGGGGGGASSVSSGGVTLLVAAGGGGGGGGGVFGNAYHGGDAGGTTGGSGAEYGGGGGGTPTAGGAAGDYGDAGAGSLGSGGVGAAGSEYGGGGGGGGYYGGGGGSKGRLTGGHGGGGGGAGSSYVDPTVGSDVSYATGAASATPSVSITYEVPPNSIDVSSSTPSIPAGGGSTFVVTALLQTSSDSPITDATVVFTSTDATQVIGSTVNDGAGYYSTRIQTGEFQGPVTITATDVSTSPALAGSTVVQQTVGPPQSVAVQVQPSSVLADGTSTVQAVATVTDQWGNALSGQTVAIASSDSAEKITAVTDNGDGTYSATITASTTIGTSTITATVTSVSPPISGTTKLTQRGGPGANITMSLNPTSLSSTVSGRVTVTVTVTDEWGAGLANQRVRLVTGASGQGLVSTTDRGNGRYTATISVSPGTAPVAIAAVDESSVPSLVAIAALARVVPAPAPAPTVAPDPSPDPSSSASSNPTPDPDTSGSAAATPSAAATTSPETGASQRASASSPLGEPIVWILIAIACLIGLGGGFGISRIVGRRIP